MSESLDANKASCSTGLAKHAFKFGPVCIHGQLDQNNIKAEEGNEFTSVVNKCHTHSRLAGYTENPNNNVEMIDAGVPLEIKEKS